MDETAGRTFVYFLFHDSSSLLTWVGGRGGRVDWRNGLGLEDLPKVGGKSAESWPLGGHLLGTYWARTGHSLTKVSLVSQSNRANKQPARHLPVLQHALLYRRLVFP